MNEDKFVKILISLSSNLALVVKVKVRVKLFLCLTEHETMKIYAGVDV
jgi:hypothetical protein